MDTIDLNLIPALNALLVEGSVTGRARRLGLSSSAMSQTLSRLRASTGDPLLVRAGRGLVPMPRAIALRDRVHALAREARDVLRPQDDSLDLATLERTLKIRANEGFVGLFAAPLVAAVIDLFSRRVVGWSMSATMTAQLVADAMMIAIWCRGKTYVLLHHSDQGSQYTSEQFQRLMQDNGVTCSMSRSGNCWDNAVMESFLSSLKTERVRNKVYRSVNGRRRFRKSGHLKFPSLAGRSVPVISRDGDLAFPLLAVDRAVSARAVG